MAEGWKVEMNEQGQWGWIRLPEKDEETGTPAGDLLYRTAAIVNGARNRTHGDKERSFKGIAKAWGRLFPERKWKGSDVPLAMVALKEQRLRHGEQSAETLREHVEDLCGYWAIYYELRAAEMEEEDGAA